jgi:hypothetical protein
MVLGQGQEHSCNILMQLKHCHFKTQLQLLRLVQTLAPCMRSSTAATVHVHLSAQFVLAQLLQLLQLTLLLLQLAPLFLQFPLDVF